MGETGCGKSVTAFSITRLISDPPGRVMSGEVLFNGADLLWGLEKEATYFPIGDSGRVKVKRKFRRIKAANERMSAVRGRAISTIFQEPTQAMNPVFSISDQLSEVLLLHRGTTIIDELLRATPDAPGVGRAGAQLLDAARAGNREGIRAAALAFGAAANAPSLGTQAFYIVRAASSRPEEMRRELGKSLDRLRIRPSVRRFLLHQRRLIEIQGKLNEVYLSEMKERQAHTTQRLNLRRRAGQLRLTHFYYRLWGIKLRLERPLKRELFWRVVRLLEGVSIANPVQVARGYPHELSGGMLQRVMIAMSLSSEPDLLIADEPTTALDVTIQAQILELMRDLKTRVGTAILLITHDLAVVAEVADNVCVMYAGRIIEKGPVRELFRRPLHPYAQGLLASIPRLDQPSKELSSIPGSVPNLITPPSGCRFHPRCPYAMPICKVEVPPMTIEGPDHSVACYLYQGPVATS
ncbi:MAG: ATP-binding cassette domain-containing protein [Thermoplasmata archaeon]|nr:ATP-binding cassette domain-containing protein [Thermoplasmata archaeon]